MSTKRKLTLTSIEEPANIRGRRRLSFLQANMPKTGLLWGTEGSVDKVLDRSSDAGDLCQALEQYDSNGDPINWPEGRLERALVELLEKCYAMAVDVDVNKTSAEEFFFKVRNVVSWAANAEVSVNIIMEVCLKLLAARRAYKNSNRKFFRIVPRARKSPLDYRIDRFDKALDPQAAATWLETFLVPVEGEQADDEMEDAHVIVPVRTAENQRCQKRRMTADRMQARPHTPPGRLRLESAMSRGWARAGYYAPAKTSRHWRRTQGVPVSPSKSRSRSGGSDADVEMLVGNLVSMAIDVTEHDS
jgi:hypothetical protein